MKIDDTVFTDFIDRIQEIIERAQNGLIWWRESYPEGQGKSDEDMDREIKEALAMLTILKAKYYE